MLAGREIGFLRNIFDWSRRVGLNHRPADYESAALPLSYAGPGRYVYRSNARMYRLGSCEFFEGKSLKFGFQFIPS